MGDVLKGISLGSSPCQKGTLFGSVPYYRKTKLSRKQLAEAWGSCGKEREVRISILL